MNFETEEKEKLIAKVSNLILKNEISGCWEWCGYVSKHGYGQFSYKKKSWKAHRIVYLLFSGDLKEGLEIDHLCRNRKCVNPKHLEQVTRAVNVYRGLSPIAVFMKRNECSKGHKYTPENTYKRPNDPKRFCKICRRETYNRMYANRQPEITKKRRQRAKELKLKKELDGEND